MAAARYARSGLSTGDRAVNSAVDARDNARPDPPAECASKTPLSMSVIPQASPTQGAPEVPRFLSGGGAAARAIAAKDWATTPLGPIPAWPASLKTVVALVVRSRIAMVVMLGHDGTMIYNDAYAVILGERHPGVLGSGVRACWPEAAEFNGRVVETVLGGASLTFRDQPFALVRNGKETMSWFTLDYSPVLDDAERPTGVLAVVVETTDRVHAEQWLQGERERLRLMFEQAPGFVAMLRGPEHIFELANPAYLQLVGHRDVFGKTVRQALPEVEGQGFFELLDGVFRSGKAFTGGAIPVDLQRTPGAQPEQRFVDLVYQPVRDADGQVVGIFAQGFDVTDRVTAERAVRSGDARNRQILDSAVDYAIVAIDLAGKVTRWNEGAHRILGWTESEMLGHDIARFFTPEDRAADRPRLEMRAALASGIGNDERWHLRKSGERFWANGEMTPVRDDAGAAIGFVKVLRDRTDAHRAAQALRQSEERLRRAQEIGGVGTFTVDLLTNAVSGTREFFRIFGMPERQEVPAPEIEALVVPEDAALRSEAATRGSTTAPLDVEYRIRRADDQALRWIARKAEYERNDAGRAVRLVGAVQDITVRKAALLAAEESAAQFRVFAQALPNHVWTAPPSGLLDWFNDRVYEYSGVAPGMLDGQGWAAIVHPDDVEAAAREWGAALAAGSDYEAEFRIRRADGAWLWHLVRALPIRAADGAIVRWVGTNTDIHERMLAEAESTRDRNRIWRLSQELMLVCDFAGVIATVNPAATRLLGWTPDEMVGSTLAAFLHPDDLDATAAELDKLARGATTLAFENRYRTKDGTYRLLDWTAVPDGGYIHAIARDVTAERDAAEERERIWRSTNDLMGVADVGGRLRSVNAAWASLLGHDEALLLAQPLAQIVEPEDRPALAAVLARGASERARSAFELRMTHADGRHALVSWTAEPVGDLFYFVGRNITEQRAAESALRQAQKMEAVGQLTGGIAHDFNNLLQGITGSLNVLQKLNSMGRVSELDRFIGSAMNSARRAAALTHRLLAFSRRQPLEPRPVALNPLVESMEDLLRRTLGERIELKTALAGDLALTRCDPNQLESAILNLAINSRDAMPDGGTLVIETCNVVLDGLFADAEQGVLPGRYVCVNVTDTGTGMTADTIAKAFEPFFTTKPIGQGTGLGLSMIYGFARQSEGYARIYSEVGVGTTFKLYLPTFLGAAQPEDAPLDAGELQPADPEDTVLVVEDEPVVRTLIVGVLAELGYRVLEAADGPSGLRVLESRERIDLVITDVGLPGLNGRQMAEAGRERRPGLKVLFMTGYAENASFSTGFLDPGMSMITKPFSMDVLARRVRDIIR